MLWKNFKCNSIVEGHRAANGSDGMMVESFAVQTLENLGKIEQLSVFMNLQLNGNHSVLTMRNRIWQRVHGFVLHGRVHVSCPAYLTFAVRMAGRFPDAAKIFQNSAEVT